MHSYNVHEEVSDKYSLRGKVFHKIREDILSGVYKQNEELKEKSIGEELGVSRTPVREALRQLELEGLVNIIPNKGAYVIGITKKDVKDIYMIRTLLEGLCARWACEFITEEQINELEENIYLSDFYAKKQKFSQVVELDNKFHEILYETSNSKVLRHILSDYHHYLQRVRKVSLASEKRAIQSNEEHRAIIQALIKKDVKTAEALAREHIMNTIKNLEELPIGEIYEEMKMEDKNAKN